MPVMDETTKILLLVIAAIFVIFLFASFIKKLNTYVNELRYVNMEIGRNEGQERDYWLRKKKRLWRIFLPFSGK